MKKLDNYTPLGFYTELNQQNHFKSYAFGQTYRLITYKNMLMPFQFVLLFPEEQIVSVYLQSYNSQEKVEITENMLANGLKVKNQGTYSILKYPGTFPILGLKFEGPYYIIINTDKQVYYSDIFYSCNSVDDCILVEYANSYDIPTGKKEHVIDFSEGFTFKCYLQAEIGKPEYVFEEEVTERMGRRFIESQVSKKVYKFTFLAPEYLCDALRIVRLCDYKTIEDQFNNYELDTFSINPKWEEQGDLAAVETEFEEGSVIVNIGGYVKAKEAKGEFDRSFDNSFKRSPRDYRFVYYQWAVSASKDITFTASMQEPFEEKVSNFTFKFPNLSLNDTAFVFPMGSGSYNIGDTYSLNYTFSKSTIENLATYFGYSSLDSFITALITAKLSVSMSDSREKKFIYSAIPLEHKIN